MKHMSIGEGTGAAWDMAHARCRAEDERTREWLDRHAYEVKPEDRDEPLPCEDCGALLTLTTKSTRCLRCRNRLQMRLSRGSVRTYKPRKTDNSEAA